MPPSKIDKRTDPAVRHLRHVREGEDRGRVFCEGFNVVEELLKSGWSPLEAFVTEATIERARQLLARYDRATTPLRLLTDSVMSFASGVDSAPGIIVIARKTPPAVKPAASPLVLVIHGLQLPQNVGALIRSAEGAGVTEVWTTKTTADPFNPKAIRGSSGSVFRIPVCSASSLREAADQLKSRGIRLLGASQKAKKSYDRADWTSPAALVLGGEGAGFSKDDLACIDEEVVIPMSGQVESLNVSNAAAVCLFEAARQRRGT
jgi:RNA methyltransferase, TrmH family